MSQDVYGLVIEFGLTGAVAAAAGIDRVNEVLEKAERQAKDTVRAIDKGLGGIPSSAFSGMQGGITKLQGSLGGLRGALSEGLQGAASYAGGLSPVGGSLVGIGAAAGGAALGVAAVGAAMIAGAFAAGSIADGIADMADSIQVSTDFLQEMQGVMILTTGSADTFDKSMNKLNLLMGESLSGDAKATAKFDALGVSLKNADGTAKNAEQTFDEVTDKLRNIENANQRAAAAQEIFGKGAKDMAGFLAKSAEEVEALKEQVKKYGVASAAAIEASGKLGDGMDLLGGAVKAGIVNAFAPLANALGTLAMKAVPIVGEAFKLLGGIIDLICGVFQLLWDGAKALWDIFGDGITFIANLIPNFQLLKFALGSTAEGSLSLREKFAIAMGDMIRFAGIMTAQVVGLFTRLQAQTHNVIAGIKNALVDSGIGKLIGVNGKMEIKNSAVEGEAAASTIRSRFENTAAAVTARYRGSGNTRADAESPGGGDLTPPTAGGAGGSNKSGGGKSAADEAAEATKKYEAALAKLQETKNELNMTDEQRKLLDEYERAGLPRSIELTGERAAAIKALVGEIQATERTKAITEQIEKYEQEIREAGMSVEDLIRVEARRSAGLSTDLSVQSEDIKKLEDKAIAADKAKKAVDALRDAEATNKEADRVLEDLDIARQGVKDPLGADARQNRTDIDREHADEQDAIYERYGREGEEVEKLIEANDRLRDARREAAAFEEQQAELDVMNEKAEKLGDFMMDLYEKPAETMKRFFADMIKNVIIAIAKATILKGLYASMGQDTGMGAQGGIGGMLGSAVMGALGLSGARAEGGPVAAGGRYLVGEKGPEILELGNLAGTVLPNHSITGGGATNTNNVELNYHAAPGQSQAQTLADARMMTDMIDERVRLINQYG